MENVDTGEAGISFKNKIEARFNKDKKLENFISEYKNLCSHNKDNEASELFLKNQKFIENFVLVSEFGLERDKNFKKFFGIFFTNERFESNPLIKTKNDFIEKNIDLIYNTAPTYSQIPHLCLRNLIIRGSPIQKDKAAKFISNKFNSWFDNTIDGSDYYFSATPSLAAYVNFFYAHDTIKEKNELLDPTDKIISAFNQPWEKMNDFEKINVKGTLTIFFEGEINLGNYNYTKDKLAPLLINNYIKDENLSNEFMRSMYQKSNGAFKKFNSEKFIDSLVNMDILEKKMPGSVDFLIQNFGILNFSRYPTDVLIEQIKDFKNSEKNSSLYGVVVYAREDWNGAFNDINENKKIIDKLIGLNYKVRIIEAGDRLGLFLKIMRVHKIFGDKFKFLIVNAHGTKDGFSLNANGNEDVSVKDLNIDNKASLYLKENVYDSNMSLVMCSCSTGKEGGFAQKFSEFFSSEKGQIISVGPDTVAGVEEINVKNGKKGVIFDVKYQSRGPEKTDLSRYYGINSPK